MNELPEALRAWESYPQFCLWMPVPRPDGRVDKIPISALTGEACDPHDTNNQLTAAAAFEAAAALSLNVGFVFRDGGPFFFLDIDHALQPDGSWSPLAMQLCQHFAGAAIEVSHSGTGLHIFGYSTSTLPHSNKNATFGLELYRRKRFVALTFREIIGEVSTDLTIQDEACQTIYFPPRPEIDPAEWTSGPDPEWMGPSDDEELLRRMLAQSDRSAAAFLKTKAAFRSLWEADGDTLGHFYPDLGGREFDHSSADAALCSHLAFWTGKDCERIERLFGRSALGQREKWISRSDYRHATIEFAVGLCNEVYKDPRIAPVADLQLAPQLPVAVAGAEPVAYQFLSPDLQLRYFAGCIYVRSRHEVFMPDGTMLSPARFNARMGGYMFAIDGQSTTTTKRAFEALTEAQWHRWPQADGTCFRPEEPPGAIVEHEGLTFVNTYVSPIIESREGDVSPFLGLVGKLFPNEIDRAIILAYMAFCVQYPGLKSQWAPVLQGVPGNGKSFIGVVLTHAIGERYTHLPNADQLGNRFNAWVEGHLFALVEEICVPGKPQIVETLKRLITGNRIEIEGKSINQRTGDNRCNFLFCSNYKDGVTKIRDDRRYAVFFTPQQSIYDLQRDGMLGSYFPELYTWLSRKGGAAHCTWFLQHYAIPDELNPAVLCQRAPETSSTAAAIVASRGSFEQEVVEAVEEGRYGFRNGWLSSCMVGDLVDERLRHERIPQNRRRGLLESLGYVRHPGLAGGRSGTKIMKENGRKPVFYIQREHPSMSLRGPAVAAAYELAQGE